MGSIDKWSGPGARRSLQPHLPDAPFGGDFQGFFLDFLGDAGSDLFLESL